MTSRHSPREIAVAAGLFLATLLCTLWVGAEGAGVDFGTEGLGGLWAGASFALPLLAILVSHELGHYFAARAHGVATSLPVFIPMPFSLIGTFGAVIRTSGRIRTRDALLDIGASGPLAGLCVALPVLAWGLASSEVKPVDPSAALEGRSLLYLALLHVTQGAIPAGYDIYLSPTAFAGWAGLLVTMMNLVPSGQLDGGHVAYALFGERQDVFSRYVRHGLLVVGLSIAAYHGCAALGVPGLSPLAHGLQMGGNWLAWWVVISLMARFAGERHAPLAHQPLTAGRVKIALLTLLLFPLLFMPTWLTIPAQGDSEPTPHGVR
jgi:membrane-associated protease RseP (regulator of RpoE activity)